MRAISRKSISHKKTKFKNFNTRINTLNIVVIIVVVVILVRLFDLQVLKNGYYEAIASGQHQIYENLTPERGKIYLEDDFSNELYPLAINKVYHLAYAVPKKIENPKEVSAKLAPILDIEQEDLLQKLSKENDLYEPLKHKLGDEQTTQIKDLELTGIYLQKETFRYYPDNNFASHVLGFVGHDGEERKGRYGIEGYYEEELGGKKGFLKFDQDAVGRLIPIGEKMIEKAEDGDDLVLTIDRTIQYYTEKKIKEAVEKFGAEEGSVVIMNPKSGEIIALANYPDFNLNEYNQVENIDVFSNSAIYDLYEPGSAFKPLVMGAALNSGLVAANTVFDDTGAVDVDEFTIKNYDLSANGKITMTEVLERSSNIGMVYLGNLLGRERLNGYLAKYGLHELSGIDLDTEAPVDIKPHEKWSDANLATISFGQHITVTPIKLVTAMSAVANNGMLMQPHVVKKIIHPDGTEDVIEPQEITQVLAPSTAATLSAMMVNVVENGHGRSTKIPGYRIAGKTGTAQVPNEDKAGYDPDKKITSFIGFAPLEDPKFVMLVKLNNPGGDVWGASTAAPVFKEIAEELFRHYQISPSE